MNSVQHVTVPANALVAQDLSHNKVAVWRHSKARPLGGFFWPGYDAATVRAMTMAILHIPRVGTDETAQIGRVHLLHSSLEVRVLQIQPGIEYGNTDLPARGRFASDPHGLKRPSETVVVLKKRRGAFWQVITVILGTLRQIIPPVVVFSPQFIPAVIICSRQAIGFIHISKQTYILGWPGSLSSKQSAMGRYTAQPVPLDAVDVFGILEELIYFVFL